MMAVRQEFWKFFLFSLFITTVMLLCLNAYAEDRESIVLSQRQDQGLQCLEIAESGERYLRIEKKRRIKNLLLSARSIRKIRRKLQNLRSKRNNFSVNQKRLRNRILAQRAMFRFGRSCFRQEVIPEEPTPPTPEPSPTPEILPTPTPIPSDVCTSITVKFNDFTKGDYPADVYNEEGDLLTDADVVVNYNADITFEFDTAYECGQYVTGDWWVKGPVTVTRMSPDYTENRHGYEIDPVPGAQSLDSRIASYHAPEHALPLRLTPESDTAISLVKAVSFAPELGCLHIIRNNNRRPCLLSAAVLTVVSEIPDPDSLRPPYIRGAKPHVSSDDIDLSVLPRLEQTASTPSLEAARNFFGGPWIDYVIGWGGRFLHPRANMRGGSPHDSLAYGTRLASGINTAMLRTFHEDSDELKRNLAVHIVQFGIDLYHQTVAGQYWRDDGGHMLGRKAPILYAGNVLRDTALGQSMLSIMSDYSGWGAITESGIQVNKTFQEDGHTYYGRSNVALFGGTKGDSSGFYGGSGTYNQKLNNCNGSRDARDPDGYRDGGILTFSHNDPDTMPASLVSFLEKYGEDGTYVNANNPAVRVVNLVDQCGVFNVQLPTVWQQFQSGERYTSAYQGCCTSKQYSYSATVIKLLGLEDEWAHPAFFDYVERFNVAPWSGVGGYSSAYGDQMFSAYYPLP